MRAYARQCKQVIVKTGSAEVSVENAADDVQLLSFTSSVGIGSGGNSFSLVELKYKFHVKEPLRQVAIFSKPPWAMPLIKARSARDFITRANLRLKVGSLELDDCGDVFFKTATEFGGVDDITPVLTSLMETHASVGLDCFRALQEMKDNDLSSEDALSFIRREGNTSESVGRKLSSMLKVLADPSL